MLPARRWWSRWHRTTCDDYDKMVKGDAGWSPYSSGPAPSRASRAAAPWAQATACTCSPARSTWRVRSRATSSRWRSSTWRLGPTPRAGPLARTPPRGGAIRPAPTRLVARPTPCTPPRRPWHLSLTHSVIHSLLVGWTWQVDGTPFTAGGFTGHSTNDEVVTIYELSRRTARPTPR